MLSHFLDALFPRTSLLGVEGEWVTSRERQLLSTSTFPVCFSRSELKRTDVHFLDLLVAAGTLDQVPLLRKAIHTFKYRRISALHQSLGQLMLDAMPGLLLLPAGEQPTLCDVPLHWTRKFFRGFNQAALLASFIAAETGWHYVSLLRRTRATGSQTRRNRSDRLTALKDAFELYPSSDIPRCVLLIDDIATTGSTLDQCAKTLKNAGVGWVGGLVIARGGH